jgi:hypothetical protein
VWNVINLFWPSSLLYWKILKGISDFTMMGWLPTLQTQLLCCKSFVVIALLSMAFGHPGLQTSHDPTSFCGDYSKKESVRIPIKPGGPETHYWTDCCQHWPTCSLQYYTKHTKMDGRLSSRRWFTFTAYAIKMLCTFPQMSYKNSNYFVLLYWCHLYACVYCCSLGCILVGALCTKCD